MNRGTVMEIGGNTAVILTPDGEFVQVRIRGTTRVGEEVTWTETDRVGKRRKGAVTNARHWIFSGVSAAVLLLLCTALWTLRVPPVVAYVSMDINPSVEFGLDAKERIRELRAVNEDARPLIDGVVYKGEPVAEVMRVIAAKLADSHILNANKEIVIASVRLRKVDAEWEAQVTEKIRQALEEATAATVPAPASTGSGLQIETLYLPVEVRDEAVENGISSGKMAFWLAAENSGREVAMDDLRKDSVQETAASAGGLKQVLEEGKIKKEDKESWKKLLSDKKEKLLKQKEKRRKNDDPSPAARGREDEPSSSPDDRPSASAGRDGEDDERGEDPGQDQGKSPDKNGNQEKNQEKNQDKDRNKSKDRDQEQDGKKGKDEDQDDQRSSGSPNAKGGRDEDDRKPDSAERDHGNRGSQEQDKSKDRGNGKDDGKKRDQDREDDR